MPSFTDKRGDSWTIAVDINCLRRVRNTLSINLADCLVLGRTAGDDRPLMDRLARDPVLFVDLLYVLCRDQCEHRTLNDAAFADIFDGPSIDAAGEALIGALHDFFQSPASRLVMRTATRVMETKARANLTEAQLDEVIDAALATAVANQFGGTSTGSPESSDATSNGGPSAS